MSVVPLWVQARLATLKASSFELYLESIERGDRALANDIMDHVERLDVDFQLMKQFMASMAPDAADAHKPSWMVLPTLNLTPARLATLKATLFEGYLQIVERAHNAVGIAGERGDRASADAMADYVTRLDLDFELMEQFMDTMGKATMAADSAAAAFDLADEFDATVPLAPMEVDFGVELDVDGPAMIAALL
jgi:hypothetical protein